MLGLFRLHWIGQLPELVDSRSKPEKRKEKSENSLPLLVVRKFRLSFPVYLPLITLQGLCILCRAESCHRLPPCGWHGWITHCNGQDSVLWEPDQGSDLGLVLCSELYSLWIVPQGMLREGSGCYLRAPYGMPGTQGHMQLSFNEKKPLVGAINLWLGSVVMMKVLLGSHQSFKNAEILVGSHECQRTLIVTLFFKN